VCGVTRISATRSTRRPRADRTALLHQLGRAPAPRRRLEAGAREGALRRGLLLGHRGDVPQSEGRRRHAGRLRRGPHAEPDLRRCVFAHNRARTEVVEVEFDPAQISLRHCSRYSDRATSRRVRTARAPTKTASIARGRGASSANNFRTASFWRREAKATRRL
jgi:hypothetical protein